MLFYSNSITCHPDGLLKPLFCNLKVFIAEGDRIGLIGANGAGKTSLIHEIRNRRPQTGFWPQELPESELETLLQDWVQDDVPESNLYSNLSRVGLKPKHLMRPMSALSYGERARAHILRFLCLPQDLVLLDEPDNHLDQQGMELLQWWLSTQKAFVLVSHQSSFLSRVCNRTWMLSSGELQVSHATGSVFLQEMEQWKRNRLEYYQKLVREADSLKDSSIQAAKKANAMERFKAKRSVRNNGGICKRDDGSGKLVRKDKFQSSVSVLKKRAQRAEETAMQMKPFVDKEKAIRPRSSRKNCYLYCSKLEINLSSAEKLRISGNNGSGKSTLLRVLAGELKLKDYDVLRPETCNLAYQDQNADSLPSQGRVADWVERKYSEMNASQMMSWLGCFNLGYRFHSLEFPSMSKGERVRFLLACCLATDPDILVLDEPVNHLDMQSRRMLAQGLKEYDGILVFVSHDEDFTGCILEFTEIQPPQELKNCLEYLNA